MVQCSSEDPGYPADELNVHSPNTRGWQSAKFSEYPQELVFALDGGDARLTQVQILSHQSKIASKIEIFIGNGSSYRSAEFKRLGYLSLDNNEKSQYQARELKTVYIDFTGSYIRLVIHRNYVNKLNLFNQVGIVAVNLIGTSSSGPRGARGLDASGGPEMSSNNPLNDLSVDMNLDPQTAAKLRLLSETKSRAIATEDYLTAKQIKAVEAELKALGSRLAQLDMAKRQAVGAEDYDRAKEIKDETDELRGDIEKKILESHIPGVIDSYMGQPSTVHHALPSGEPQVIPAPASPERVMKPKFAPSASEGKDDGDDNPFLNLEDTSPQAAVHRTGADVKGVPLNIDDIPVGKPQVAPGLNDPPPKRKSNESDPVPYGKGGIASAPEEYLPNGDRPIRPKAEGPSEFDEEAAYLPDRFGETFPEGEHPLEGVPNAAELPAPEELVGKSKDVADQNGVTALAGEYIARCLFSKNWQLREAAITKVHMRLETEFENDPGITSCIPALSTIVRVGVEDKIQQVLFNAVALLDDMLAGSRRAKIGRSTIAPALDPVTANLIEKLSDGKERIREGARKGTEILASSANIGPAVVGAHALRPLTAKQKAAWRPTVARLQILTELINQYGLGNSSSGIMAPAVMKFVQDNGCFTHSNGEVRDATKDLTVAVQKHTGTGAIEAYLKDLRQKQREEYEYAFDGGTGPMKRKAEGKSSLPKFDPPSPRHAGAKEDKGFHSPAKKGHDEKDGEVLDFTTCMFCGISDPTWNEDALDLHYWKDCAMLAPCPACKQVVEVAGMADHLLEECEHKADYMQHESGLAVKKSELDSYSNLDPLLSGKMYCPLCIKTVSDTDDDWKSHLFTYCTANTRKHAGSKK